MGDIAGGWSKVRVSLPESPEVIAMSRLLYERPDFRDWAGHDVTLAALRCVTTMLLVRVWDTARQHGKLLGDDLHLPGLSLCDLDALAGAPGIGVAMGTVGWALVRDVSEGVILPKFVRYNAPRTAAERQRDSRARKKTCAQPVASPVTNVTEMSQERRDTCHDREEKRREENTNTPLPPLGVGEREENSREPEARRSLLPADRPDLAAIAKRVVDYYQRIVRPGHYPGAAVGPVMDLLDARQTEESLCRCADRYARRCADDDKPARYRESAKTFFQSSGGWASFLEDEARPKYNPPVAPPVRGLATLGECLPGGEP